MTGASAGRGGAPDGSGAQPSALTLAISSEIVALYARVYGHDRTSATTYINDNVVLCVLENILTDEEATPIDVGSNSTVIDGRVGFQTDTEDEFTEAIERLTHRRVVAFMSANQTLPGVASTSLAATGRTPRIAPATSTCTGSPHPAASPSMSNSVSRRAACKAYSLSSPTPSEK